LLFSRIIRQQEEASVQVIKYPFVTSTKKYGVDEYAIKYIVGHKISDLTEKVYTKREFDWLKEEIEKIK
jgi:hypothetical protein